MDNVSFRLEIPEQVHRQLKIKAIEKKKTLTAYLIEILAKESQKK
jgi:predicted HicB family RNase H-like nuclease